MPETSQGTEIPYPVTFPYPVQLSGPGTGVLGGVAARAAGVFRTHVVGAGEEGRNLAGALTPEYVWVTWKEAMRRGICKRYGDGCGTRGRGIPIAFPKFRTLGGTGGLPPLFRRFRRGCGGIVLWRSRRGGSRSSAAWRRGSRHVGCVRVAGCPVRSPPLS